MSDIPAVTGTEADGIQHAIRVLRADALAWTMDSRPYADQHVALLDRLIERLEADKAQAEREGRALDALAAHCLSATPEPVPGRVYWFAETVAAPPRYLVRGSPGHPAHLTSDPLKATRFESHYDAVSACCSNALKLLDIEAVRAVEHLFMEPAK